ncbi:MAG: hypothetical protein OEY01_00015 [Desulfobulbaceae bacterium]|nr:hypothetical protein [Desulfobulbaceae bacterium]HIJ77678.1 hypothetical protein [Deltaproteobacteria bacterium]
MRNISIFLLWISVVGMGSTVFAAEKICYKCHPIATFQGKSVHAPVAKGACISCHNPHVAKYEGLLQQKGADLCYSCHQQERIAYSKGKVHKPVQDGDCGACHAPHAAGRNALLRKPLAQTCLGCHQEENVYKNKHKPYADGNCGACHLSHNSSREQLLKSSGDQLCLQCHKDPEVLAGHKGFPRKVRLCSTCHNPHGSEKKGLMRAFVHPEDKKGCNSCHSKDIRDSDLCFSCHAEVKKQVMATHSHLQANDGNSCMGCHSPHAADTKNLLRGKENQLCWSCHSETAERMAPSLHKHPAVKSCSECHAPHGANQVAMLKAEGNALCSRCHETQGKFSHPVGGEIVDHRTDKVMDCLTCHNPMGSDHRFHLKQSGKKTLCVQCHRSY